MNDHNELACSIEEVVCSRIGIELNRLFEDTKKGDCVKARHLSIFILHTLYHIPISFLSKRYKCSPRHIFRAISQLRDYVSTSRQYRELIQSLADDLESMDITK